MDREQAKETIKQQLASYLMQKGIDINKPFNCLNPAHPDRHPSMSYDKKNNKCKCFSCDASYDIFDLIGIDYNLTGKDIFNKAYELYGISIDNEYNKTVGSSKKQINLSADSIRKAKEYKQKQEEEETALEKEQIEIHKKLFNQAKQNRNKAIDYLVSRGISKEYAETLNNIGYYHFTLDIAKETKAPVFFYDKTDKTNNVFIVEYAENCYMQRFINRSGSYKNLNPKGIKTNIYNADILKSAEVVFVVEGFFDSLSINSLGYNAIALNSTNNKNKLIDYVKLHQKEISKDLIIILLGDNDAESNAGQECNNYLLDKLKDLGIKTYIKTEILQKESVKDMNELLIKDAEKAKEVIKKAVEEVKQEEKERKESFYIEYKRNSEDTNRVKIQNDYESIDNQFDRIDNRQREHIKTGFEQFDDAINRGLKTGLYIIGAKAGTGKTAFILQVSDYIARTQNKKVLFFSLEQGRNALFNRRIARLTFEQLKAKTKEEIKNGRQYQEPDAEDFKYVADFQAVEFYGEDFKENEKRNRNIYNAIETFKTYAKNVFTIDNIYTVEEIKKVVMSCINSNVKPVIFIDYLQILKPSNKPEVNKYEERQIINLCITELKELSIKENLTIFLVSSLNRQNKEIEMKSYSGSSGIEFNAEFAGTLQIDRKFYKASNEEEERIKVQEVMKESHYKRLKLSILKQKDGISGIDINFKLYAPYYYFEEVKKNEEEEREEQEVEEKPPKKR